MEPRDVFLAPELSQEAVLGYLSRLGFQDPERVDAHLQQISALVEYPERLADSAELLLTEMAKSADPDAAARNLETFLENTPSPINLLSLMEVNPRAAQVLLGVLGGSPFLTQTLIRNTEYFHWLTEGNRLEQVCDGDYFYSEAAKAIRPFPDRDSALDALRRFRRRESLRIGAQDILGLTRMTETVSQVSDLADAVLSAVLGIVSGDRLPAASGFTVIALGKLGGRELNFSSDVDLLFLHSDTADPNLMIRLARDYLKALSEYSGEGHLYRVDLRLRPMGRTGEIIYSEKACKHYYGTWADTTDRLALIKCRFVAGDRELGERFVRDIQEFVYKKYLDYAAVEEIGWIKRRTDESLRRKRQIETHVKLGLGGIREIEFFVQAFQILYGGNQVELRHPSTLIVLKRLVDIGLVEQSDFEVLQQAYIFLRDLEHKLQLVHDLQTHSLPESEPELRRCIRRMGYRRSSSAEELEAFRHDLSHYNQSVHRIFQSLFASADEGRDLRELVLNPDLSVEAASERLAEFGIQKTADVVEGIRMLGQATAFPHSPSRLRNLLANLVPVLVGAAASAPDPREMLTRFDRFCESLGSRAALYTEMIENEGFAKRLLGVLACSDSLAETVIRRPELVDAVASVPRPADPGVSITDSVTRARQKGTSIRNALREFKQREEFKIALWELEAPGKTETRHFLSDLAEACVRLAWETALNKGRWLETEPCALFALGKLGGRELVFHSDLDLVFIFDDQKTASQPSDFHDLLKDFREELTTYTEAGRAYEIDFRLRPEGRRASEAVALTRFREYFKSRAEPWERLAYVKLRPILSQDFGHDLPSLVFERSFSAQDVAKLRHLRTRKELEVGREEKNGQYNLKVGRGALLDIQFIVQFLQIQNQVIDPNLLSAIDKLSSMVKLGQTDGLLLKEAACFLYSLESVKDLVGDRLSSQLSRRAEENQSLAKRLGLASGQELLSRYEGHCEKVRAIYERVFRAY